MLTLVLGFTAISAAAFIAGLIGERTEIGAGLAEAVKGRPYTPNNAQE